MNKKSILLIEEKALLEKSDIAILVNNKEDQIEFANKKLCDIFGYTQKEIMELNQHALIFPHDRDEMENYHTETVKNAKSIPTDYEIRGIKKSGETIDLHMIVIPRYDEKMEITGTLSYIWDISKSKSVEESLAERERELIESEIELQGILESTADGILAVDKNGKVIKTNKRFAKLWNIPVDLIRSGDDDKLLSYVLDQLVDPEQFLSKVIKLYTSKERDFDTLQFKDGRTFERYSTPLLIGEDVLGRIWSFRDVSEKVKAEKAQHDSEEKFRSLIENSPIIIMRLEKDGIISFINYKYANQQPEYLIGKSFYEFIPSDFKDIAKETIEKVIETKRNLSFENIELGVNDKVKWFRNNISPEIENGAVQTVNMICMDITELKELDIMRNEFVASVSHEIRTPLTIIRESLSIMESGITGKLNKDQHEIVKPCLNEVDRLSRIINNLLDITKMDGQNIKLVREMVNIIDLAKSVLYSFQNKADSKNISLEFVSEVNELSIYCDRDRIIQVFINLIGNAVKFTDSGFVRVIIEFEDEEVTCRIADTGKGIEEEDLGTVFDRFHQVGKVVRAGESGSGLGLTISKGIVKLHKGKIWVKSKLGIGSEFVFTLPKLSTHKFIVQNIGMAIDEAKAQLTKSSLLLLRIDNYEKLINEFGVESVTVIRDKIFKKISTDIAYDDFLHRYGDNEFVLLSNVTKQNMNRMISNIKTLMNDMLGKYNKNFSLEISTAIAVYPEDGNMAEQLLDTARRYLDEPDNLP